jgi:aldehyde:ferredoxin oxidoreductase
MGAVMGAKNLKAIVVQGGEKIPVLHAEETKSISEDIRQCAKEFAFPKMFTEYGTPMFINLLESLGLVYGENWRRKIEHEDITSLDIAAFHHAAESKSHGCYRCPLRCGKHWQIRQGPYAGEAGFKYEVAFIMTLGMTLGLRDVPSVLHIVNELNRMGIDINEFGGTLGMVTDASVKGILSREGTDGFIFDWGNVEAYTSIIDRISHRRGFGDVLAEGTKRAAERIGGGAKEYALHMKGMHWPAHSAPPFVLAFSLSTRGGDFLKAMPYLLMQSTNKDVCQKLFGAAPKTMDIYSHEAKGRAVWWHENYKLLLDSLGVCFYLGLSMLPHGRLLPDDLAVACRAATGVNMDGKDLLEAAERSNQIQRAINALHGLDRRHDAFTRRPEPDSWAQGIDLDRPGMLDEYYAYRGLSRNGLPTMERLQNVGLQEVADQLNDKGLLDHCWTEEDHRPESIIKNPTPDEIGGSIKAKVQSRIRKRIMGRLSEDPLTYREHFRKKGRKNRGRKTGPR